MDKKFTVSAGQVYAAVLLGGEVPLDDISEEDFNELALTIEEVFDGDDEEDDDG